MSDIVNSDFRPREVEDTSTSSKNDFNGKKVKIAFKNRSLQYKITFVTGCIFASPVIFLYYAGKFSWKGAKWGAKEISKLREPLSRAILAAARALFITFPKLVYHHVLAPIGRAIRTVANLTHKHVLTPIGRAIQTAANAVFIKFPELLYKHVLAPIGRSLRNAAKWTYKNILTPLSHAIKEVAEAIFITLPKLIGQAAV